MSSTETDGPDAATAYFALRTSLLCTADFDGHFARVAAGWTQLLGYSPQELCERPSIEFVHPEDVEATLAVHGRLCAGGEVCGFENRYRGSDGRYRWLRWTAKGDEITRQIHALAVDVTESHLAESRASAAAFRDELTGLPNRALFLDRVDHALGHLSRERSSLAVIVLDVDDFRAFNDSLGRAEGDALLQAVAARLSRFVRPTDTIARIGADEFGVLCLGVDDNTALAVVERLSAAIAEPLVIRGRTFTQTASAGIAIADSPRLGEMVVADAELAAHRASAGAPGSVAFFARELRAASARRLELRDSLRHAAAQDEFELDYQPVVATDTRRPIALEALVRWRHPRLGRLPPGEFIPLAEQSGQIAAVGAWVLRAACAEAAGWADTSVAPAVAVNISAHQLADPGLVDTVATALAASGLAPERLWLEVTESALLAHPAAALETLAALRRLGLEVALDDFGEGQSSLSQLRLLSPVSVLKLGTPFVRGLEPGAQRERAIVDSVITLARALGLRTVAEGVEKVEQLQELTELGCEAVQGFLLGRPRPAQSLGGWLTGERLDPVG
jgi:diguanylate cyclase (GGDEF)-like protein/PAS domain S-box-containing protein